MKKGIRPYRGAGVLFYFRDPQRGLHVLLGQRRAAGHWWDIPAGGMDRRDNGDFAVCAERETREEFGWPTGVPGLKQFTDASTVRYRLPFYGWTTYLFELVARPDKRTFPDVRARDYHHEFLGHQWFELRLGGLPWRVHPMLYPALLKLMLAAKTEPSQPMNRNSIMVLQPYRHAGTWVFDDPATGLVQEPFVCGIPEMVDELVKDIPHAEQGFRLLFSAHPFPGATLKLTWRRPESGGNWYWSERHQAEGWLCPALFKYFAEAPPELHANAEPL